jgi:hypothetical protein
MQNQISDEDLIVLVSDFSEYRIKTKYFPLMFESPLIMEPLKLIYILLHYEKFNLDDIQRIRKVFQENFRFFSELEPVEEYNDANNNFSDNRYGKLKFLLCLLFFSLILFSGIGCIYSIFIFLPLAIFFGLSLVLGTCLINRKNPAVEIVPAIIPKFDETYTSCKSELNTLKKNLNKLRNFFAEKYQIKMTNVDNVYAPVEEQSEGFSIKKKSVTFAPRLSELNLFNIESPESRSRANSYENNVNLRAKF